ncbi:MAG: hypothetical protein V1794_14530 [Candidatus Glassbacteria bacterium]
MRKLVTAISVLLLMTASYRVRGADDNVTLKFTFVQDAAVYEESDYGEPPQVAIWLEEVETGVLRTVYVTYRTAAGDFYGKVECQVSLPAWIAAYRKEFGKEEFPTPRDPLPEAMTSATSTDSVVETRTRAARGKEYRIWIEVNVAGDFNAAFQLESPDLRLDYHGNGQPSLVYAGRIVAEPGNSVVPRPFGRTDQYIYTGEILENLDGMDSALACFTRIEVSCSEN